MPLVVGAFDMMTILLSVAAIGLTGLLAMRGTKGSVTEYFLAGRATPWLLVGMSLFATTLWTSCLVIAGFGHAGTGEVIGTGLLMVLGLSVLGTVFVKVYRTSGAMTLPSFLGERYGRPVQRAAAVASIVLSITVRIPFTIIAACHLLSVLLGWDSMSTALLLIVLPGLFAVAGGYGVVIATQGAASVIAAVSIVTLMIMRPASLAVLFPLSGESPAAGTWPLVLAAGTMLTLWVVCFDQFTVQRIASVSSPQGARRASLLGTLLLLAALVLAGVLMMAVPGATEPGHTGYRGILGAGILGLAMASLSSEFMSVSSLFVLDLLRGNVRLRDEAVLVLGGRLVGTMAVILAILFAPLLGLMDGSSITWMLRLFVVLTPPVATVTILGMAWPRMHGRGAFWALFAGWCAAAFATADMSGSISELAFRAALGFVVSGIMLIAVSLTVVPMSETGNRGESFLRKGLQVRKP